VNVFGGIVNCATIANGIINASLSLKLNIPLIVRLEGENLHIKYCSFMNSIFKKYIYSYILHEGLTCGIQNLELKNMLMFSTVFFRFNFFKVSELFL
jgi:hypothetical protein